MLRPCAIEGCERPAGVPGSARGFCVAHYGRFRRHRDPLGGHSDRTRAWEPICRLCGLTKEKDEFPVRRESGRRRTECRACQSAKALAWGRANEVRRRESKRKYQARNTEARAEKYLMRVYGVTREQAQLIREGGSCAICGSSGRRLHVDHDHASGAIRGLLCKNCNHGLGMFRDNYELVAQAALYLQHPAGITSD